MKIAIVSTFDICGGAARATYRLHEGLRLAGESSCLIVKDKRSQDDAAFLVAGCQSETPESACLSIVQRQYIDSHRTDISNTIYSLPYPGQDISTLPLVREADVINLHWIAHFQSPITLARLFALGKPVVWTLHDQWAFTGGCHYSAGCMNYQTDCAGCPQLTEDIFGLASAVLKDKIALWRSADLTIVSPSRWLASRARESALFRNRRIEVIPNSLDTEVFKPMPKPEAKAALGIPPGSTAILFSADDAREKRKGFHDLVTAVRHCLSKEAFRSVVNDSKIVLLSLGHPTQTVKDLGLPVIPLGFFRNDDDVSAAYSAADVFVLPSLEDNLPNTMLEAMSCGTPVIGFETGGIPDVVEDGVTGFLVPRGDSIKLGEAIISALQDSRRLAMMGEDARKKAVSDFGLDRQADRYISLYAELCHKRQIDPCRLDKDSEERAAGCVDTTLGPHFGEIADKVLLKSLKEAAPVLASKLQAAQKELEVKREELVRRDEVIARQSETIGFRDREIAGLKDTILLRDEEIVKHTDTIRLKDAETETYKNIISSRDEEITGFKDALRLRDEEITGFKDALRLRDEQIASLKMTLDFILASRSWRWTKLLRQLGDFLEHGKRGS